MFDGSLVPTSMVRVRPVAGARRLLLASDGYLILGASLDESEAVTREAIDKDPLMMLLHPRKRCQSTGSATTTGLSFCWSCDARVEKSAPFASRRQNHR